MDSKQNFFWVKTMEYLGRWNVMFLWGGLDVSNGDHCRHRSGKARASNNILRSWDTKTPDKPYLHRPPVVRNGVSSPGRQLPRLAQSAFGSPATPCFFLESGGGWRVNSHPYERDAGGPVGRSGALRAAGPAVQCIRCALVSTLRDTNQIMKSYFSERINDRTIN